MHVDPSVRSVALYDATGNLFASVPFGERRGAPAGSGAAAPATDPTAAPTIDVGTLARQSIQFNGLTTARIQVPVGGGPEPWPAACTSAPI